MEYVDSIVRKIGYPDLIWCFQKTYAPLIEQCDNNSLRHIVRSLEIIDLEENDFSKLFDWLLFRGIQSSGRLAGEGVLPKDLSSFMTKLTKISVGSVVYNPFAGLSSFGINLEEDITYVGQELDRFTWSLGVLRRIAYGKSLMDEYNNEDSITEWINGHKFDLIISAPPFTKPGKIENDLGINIRSNDQFVIEKGLESLTDDGKLVILVPERFLFSSGPCFSTRKKIVEEDFLETVISLPSGVFYPFSAVKSSILVLNRNKKNRGQVTMMESSHYEVKGEKKVNLHYEEMKRLLESETNDLGIFRISNHEIIEENFDLDVSRHLLKEKVLKNDDDLKYVKLSEIFSEIKGRRSSDHLKIKTISIKDLTKDNLDYKLSFEDVDTVEGKLKNGRIISESCLMVAKIGNDLKPTYFEFQGEPIGVSNNVMTYQVSEDLVDLDYLINELYSSFVVRQLLVYRRGAAQQSITKADFLQIQIPLPSLKEQQDKMKGVKEAYIKSKLKEVELQKEILGYKDEAFREFASIKHTFRQYLNALKSNVSGTRKFISKNEGKAISLETMYSINLNRNLGEHLLSLEGTIDSMSKLISEEYLDKGEAEILDPKNLIEEAQNRFKNPDVFKFNEIFVDHSAFASEGGYLNPFIKITKEGFFRIFANIVYNAVEHGFKNRKGNIIRTSVSFDEAHRLVLIEISNNGKPISEKFTQQHLTTRGEKTTDSSGTGAGGADIKGILQKYNAQFELKKDDSAEFPVTYVLKFPLNSWLDFLDSDDEIDFNLDDLNSDK
ncbi:MAG: N-6 DNA methylase [Bacteroidota bacterium]